jgi:Cu-Zn family superoxide dismutase
MNRLGVLTLALVGMLAGCASTSPRKPDAIADLAPASGSQVSGTATFMRIASGGVHMEAKVSGLTPGEHGIHVHEVGDCSAPDATSAKGHFNPTGKFHGAPGGEHHAGDMPNLMADADGKASYSADLPDLAIGSGDGNILGRGVIIHAAADDYKSQPAGNSGKRVACGVIKAGA